MVRHRLALGVVVSGLLGLAVSAPTEPQCPSDSQVVFEVQPFKIICGQETQTLMITKTYTVPFGPDKTGSNNTPDQPGSPGSPPGPVTKTVYEVCENCPNTRIPPAPDCTECVVTIVTTRPPLTGPTPSLTTITTGCATDATDCKATTIPPAPDCTGICTATIITTPPPVTTTTITTGCATDVTDCQATTIPPAPDCTGVCTATVITPPPTSDPATTPPPRTTTTITTGCATDVTDCVATTIPPAPDCTGICTATVITPPPTSNPATTSPPPGTTTTITTGCATDVTDCEATTIPPAPDCTGICTATVITTSTPTSTPATTLPPPGTTTTVTTGCATDVTECEATTIPPASDCTGICTATIITTEEPSTTSEESLTTEPPSTTSDEPSTTSEEPTTSTAPAFSCDAGGYLIQRRTLYRLNLDTGANPVISNQVGPGGDINAIGYNPLDDYIYGIPAGNSQLIRIDANGGWTVYPLSGLPPSNANYNVGDFDTEGNLWVSRNGEEWAKIDLRPGSSTYGTVVDSGTALNPGISVSDWAMVRGGGNYMYSISRGAPAGGLAFLQRFSLDTKTWETLANYGQLGGTNSFGGQYPAGNGIMYGSENASGGIWRFNVLDPEEEPTPVADGPTSFSNDGARCINAPDPESAADPTN